MQKPSLMEIRRFMLCAHRIIRAKLAHFQGVADVFVNAATNLNEAAQRSFRIGSAGVKKDSVAEVGDCVNAFPNRTSRIAMTRLD